MKKTISFVVCVAILISSIFVFSTLSSCTSEKNPIMAITTVPEYGDSFGVFAGQVFYESGSELAADNWKVICYLQVADVNQWYIKPYDDSYINDVRTDGSFSVQTVTASSDKNAVLFDFFLVPASYFSGSESTLYDSISKAAVDKVRVSRKIDSNGNKTYTVTPNRQAPDIKQKEFYLPKVSADKISVDVDFYATGANGRSLSDEEIDAYLTNASYYADTIRIYSSESSYDKVYKKAHDMNFNVIGTAFFTKSSSEKFIYEQLDNLIKNANEGLISTACVGSECLYRGDFSADTLIKYVKYVRKGITDPKIAVTVADTVDKLLENADLVAELDLLFPNIFPIWEGVSANQAVDSFIGAVNAVKIKYNKPLIVSETGWSTNGSSIGNAVPDDESAKLYYNGLRKWSLNENIPILFFQLCDCEYKGSAQNHNYIESHFGFFTSDFTLKSCYADCEPFKTNILKYSGVSTSLNKTRE